MASAASDFALSGKLDATMSLIKHIRSSAPNDKVVIVSNFKIALDVIAGLLDKLGLKYRRVDGTTKQSENQVRERAKGVRGVKRLQRLSSRLVVAAFRSLAPL